MGLKIYDERGLVKDKNISVWNVQEQLYRVFHFILYLF